MAMRRLALQVLEDRHLLSAVELFLDLNPGEASSNPDDFMLVGEQLFFTAEQATSGRELWRTDGTRENTVLLRDINPGPDSADPNSFMALNGKLFFFANTASGQAFCVTDGTPAGTIVLLDGALGASITNLTVWNNSILFAATSDTGATELWQTDGTIDGTAPFFDFGTASQISDTIASGNLMFFVKNDVELWRTNGTAAGTRRLHEIFHVDRQVSLPTTHYLLVSVHDSIYLVENPRGYSNTNGLRFTRLWRTDGVTMNLIRGISGVEADYEMGAPFPVGDAVAWFEGPREGSARMYRSDGTSGGTEFVAGIPVRPNASTRIADDNQSFIFSNGVHITDATATGTIKLVGSTYLNTEDFFLAGAFDWLDGVLLTSAYYGGDASHLGLSFVTWTDDSISVEFGEKGSRPSANSCGGIYITWTTREVHGRAFILGLGRSPFWALADLESSQMIQFAEHSSERSVTGTEFVVVNHKAVVRDLCAEWRLELGRVIVTDGTFEGTFPISDAAYPLQFAPSLDDKTVIFAGSDRRLHTPNVGTELWIVNSVDVPPPSPFDLNFDQQVDGLDVDVIVQLARDRNPAITALDYDGDHQVDIDDVRHFLELTNARPGDANLDGDVDELDFAAWNSHKFQDNTTWSKGDWDLNGVTDVRDFNLWSANRDQPLAIPSSASSDTTTENASQIADEDAGNERNADNPKNLIDSANADQVFALGHIAHSLYTDADFVGPRQFKIRRSSTTAERATAAAGKSDDHDAGAIGLSTSSRMV